MKFLHITIACTCLLLSACSLTDPMLKHLPTHQGIPVDPNKLSQVEVGMPQASVQALLGAPATKHPFDPHQWIYLKDTTSQSNEQSIEAIVIEFDHDLKVRQIH